MSVTAVEGIFVGHRLSHLGVKLSELVEDSEIWLAVGVVSYPNKV
jgi:hypothetical protein